MSIMMMSNQSINQNTDFCRLRTQDENLKRSEFFIIKEVFDNTISMSNSNVFCLKELETSSKQILMYLPQKTLTEKQIRNLLIRLNFRFTVKGADYVIEAIKLAYYDKSLLNPIKNLYKEVAKKYNQEYKYIQRSIIGTIDVMNNHITHDQLRSFFHIYDFDIVPTKYFFTTVIDYLYDENN